MCAMLSSQVVNWAAAKAQADAWVTFTAEAQADADGARVVKPWSASATDAAVGAGVRLCILRSSRDLVVDSEQQRRHLNPVRAGGCTLAVHGALTYYPDMHTHTDTTTVEHLRVEGGHVPALHQHPLAPGGCVSE